MNAKKFSDAMSELDSKYVDEAIHYKKKQRKRFFPLAAACACLVLVLPLTAFAIDIIQYNAAVDYLTSLGIQAEDLSDYSRKKIKEAAKTIDAGESNSLSEEILKLLPDGEETIDTPTQVTSEQVKELTPTMTREDVLALLGNTQDIGSGMYVYIYEVDQQYLLRIPFAGDEAQLGVTGEDLLKALEQFNLKKELDKPLNTVVTRKEYSVERRNKEIMHILKEKKEMFFEDLFDHYTRDYIVVTFLSILDLAKKGNLFIKQNYNHDKIVLQVGGNV